MGVASHENEPGIQVIELKNHAPEPKNHANNHAPELKNHALFETDQLTDLPPDLQKRLTDLKK